MQLGYRRRSYFINEQIDIDLEVIGLNLLAVPKEYIEKMKLQDISAKKTSRPDIFVGSKGIKTKDQDELKYITSLDSPLSQISIDLYKDESFKDYLILPNTCFLETLDQSSTIPLQSYNLSLSLENYITPKTGIDGLSTILKTNPEYGIKFESDPDIELLVLNTVGSNDFTPNLPMNRSYTGNDNQTYTVIYTSVSSFLHIKTEQDFLVDNFDHYIVYSFDHYALSYFKAKIKPEHKDKYCFGFFL